nr:LysR substrate-binding domain-containing protein [uncultured Moellerella sp.]
MNINQLKSFVEVVKNDFNITNAAEKLYTSQPTISKQLKILEEELSVSLFTRKNNNLIALSAKGEQVHKVASDILAQLDKIKSIVTEDDSGQKIDLHIATTHTQIRYTLPIVIDKFKAMYPNVSLHFHQGAPAQIAEMVKNGDVDFAIATESMHLYEDLITLPCYRWTRSVIVPHSHPLAAIEHISIEDLAMYPIITYVFGFNGRSKLDKVFYQHDLSPNIALTATDTEIIKFYVKRGIGVGVIATVAFDRSDEESLRCINIDHLVQSSYTHICLNKHTHLKDYMYDFISLYAPHIDKNTIQLSEQLQPINHPAELYQSLPLLVGF